MRNLDPVVPRDPGLLPGPDLAEMVTLLYQQILGRAARALVVDDQAGAAGLLALLPLERPEAAIAIGIALARAVLAVERSEP